MNKKHKGALAELKASSWLLSKGFEVFRNVSPHGPVDIVALNPKTKETILIDVKTTPSTEQKKERGGIRILSFDPLSGNCELH